MSAGVGQSAIHANAAKYMSEVTLLSEGKHDLLLGRIISVAPRLHCHTVITLSSHTKL